MKIHRLRHHRPFPGQPSVWLGAFNMIRHIRLDFLPPLMVYMAAGISGLTGIVGTFFVKDYLGLSAEFLATLGFWVGLPWALKMPLGHVVDLLWRWKSALVIAGASLIAASLGILLGLISNVAWMTQTLPVEVWFVISALLAPLGYVMQDVVADAMTVEAVPAVDEAGQPYDDLTLKRMHTTMQTLGRVAIVGGGIAVSVVNIVLFNGIDTMSPAEQLDVYRQIYTLALLIPVISVLGVVTGAVLQHRRRRTLQRRGLEAEEIERALAPRDASPDANWTLLGGSFTFVLFTLVIGLSALPYNQEIIFVGSLAIILFLMARLLRELPPPARRSLWTTAVVIFVFRALPGPGAGATWWQIDTLGFDQPFLAKLALIGSCLALVGMFIFRRFMAEKSIIYVIGFLTLVGTTCRLPLWGCTTACTSGRSALTGGVVDTLYAVVDTALGRHLGQSGDDSDARLDCQPVEFKKATFSP